MPKVNPETGEPMSDAPDMPEDQRGGKQEVDLGSDVNPTGSDAPTQEGKTD